MPKLGVNIDHVATLRQARRGVLPDPVEAARICERAGAHSIVAHLREDRRHINDADIRRLRKSVRTRLNLEMSINKNVVALAAQVRPDQATLVPEKREEITTEGGLNVIKYFRQIKTVSRLLTKKGIAVSLFVDPVRTQIYKSYEMGVPMIELHTGRYAEAKTTRQRTTELKKLKNMTRYALGLGLIVHAGHGLNYQNTKAVAAIPGITELNIGHSIVAQSVFTGLKTAVREMNTLCRGETKKTR